ncbi:MAG: sodium:proton exchanger [Flavobacteriaceae bacterium CG_4_8_14_3_um_filter_34_10]|nr:calcium/sodium antiporter [Flavobacteriia bacterium]OIP49994.1 MAG: sodium:proton exchanger [Flavobacteriaceae bacterium CG2_30_34_30]PIQ19400.1 MAG: sodium:proton exchanger [Flavobacteriaceae bacterium CG18_big_fil_WC_8_21_14_2_50_34_36]PIV51032.1 MAG: sodium:proton exchanger [Flavobacteriaceae bacterium CG02_land_8_20_14_3_00_34_13]PIX08278.1 MAG: sodium:proton exchanger [Flavobacteriaceae bacterium CG_4_8_14_3_um_filter_34_10]PIZ07326.1 MAG: sodium:proton exchanger [Flavobacteriaceae bac
MLDILLLLSGFIALIFGADKLVDAASALAAKFGIPNIVIGLTIVAFGTSAPELVVNVIAAVNNNAEMVLGNVLGSNIFNVLGILGISAIIYPLAVKTNTTWYEIPLSLLAAFVVFITAIDVFLNKEFTNIISRSDAILLLLFFTIFLVYNIAISKSEVADEKVEIKKQKTFTAVLFLFVGLAGLVIGGQLIVSSATSIALSFGLSERVIGLTIVSIGTSLPELATSIVAVRKKNVDIAIGNVVGSNIFNIFFVLGVSAFITPVVVASASFIDIGMNIASGILLFLFVFTGKYRRIDRWEGIILLSFYIGYLTYLIGF